jgi:hypothetical protein
MKKSAAKKALPESEVEPLQVKARLLSRMDFVKHSRNVQARHARLSDFDKEDTYGFPLILFAAIRGYYILRDAEGRLNSVPRCADRMIHNRFLSVEQI